MTPGAEVEVDVCKLGTLLVLIKRVHCYPNRKPDSFLSKVRHYLLVPRFEIFLRISLMSRMAYDGIGCEQKPTQKGVVPV